MAHDSASGQACQQHQHTVLAGVLGPVDSLGRCGLAAQPTGCESESTQCEGSTECSDRLEVVTSCGLFITV